MKKVLSILVFLTILTSGIGTVAVSNQFKSERAIIEKINNYSINFSPLIIEKNDDNYIEVNLQDVSTYLMNPGRPKIPKLIKNIEIPFGAKNVKVEVFIKNIQEYNIDTEIKPSPIHIPLVEGIENVFDIDYKDEEIYSNSDLYPSSWYTYNVGCGLNEHKIRVTHVKISIYPIRYNPALSLIYFAEKSDVKLTYEEPETYPFSGRTEYDMVIIGPSNPLWSKFIDKLVAHKNSFGINTLFKTTKDIYNEYPGVDKPEQIKYFIKDAIEKWNITYVLLIGGLKSLVYGKPRDDENQGTRDWYVPVRYNNVFDNPEHPLANFTIHDPGVICDLYYADIYKDGGVFEDWDPNGDGIFASWGKPGYENDTGIDLYPDVALGRLACRNIFEVKSMVDKIIRYEKKPIDPSWFKKMSVISGDGFLDQEDLDIQWNISDLPDGKYTIYARSNNPEGVFGPIDTINITIDMAADTNLSFNHDDHLKIDKYPFPPIAEIVSPSEGNILGYNDYFYSPPEGLAYCNIFSGWANVEYSNKILHIRGKSYDPQPYGNITNIHVWIINESDQIVFDEWRNGTEMYYEGEWVTGEKLLLGGGGALHYMPEDYEKEILWTSNGKFTGQQDVIKSFSKGAGFVFFSGHGNPQIWSDHLPGVPGNRRNSGVDGLLNIGWSYPYFPMNRLTNFNKPPVVLVGGCHNAQFNVSLITSMLDKYNSKKLWVYGQQVPECWAWYLTKLWRRGAIATIGNTGLGYGILGKECTIEGLDGGICIEFFKQYGQKGHRILGDVFQQTVITYLNTFDMEHQDHAKSVHQWVLLGDPSLMIGGYS
jgi:hypothetical protein